MASTLVSVRQVYAHDAILDMAVDADERAPGAAITVALCGSWDHDPPCPLAPHHTEVHRTGTQLRLRVLFATEPDREQEVRRRIDAALSAGSLTVGDDAITVWQKRSSQPATLEPGETRKAARLAAS